MDVNIGDLLLISLSNKNKYVLGVLENCNVRFCRFAVCLEYNRKLSTSTFLANYNEIKLYFPERSKCVILNLTDKEVIDTLKLQ